MLNNAKKIVAIEGGDLENDPLGILRDLDPKTFSTHALDLFFKRLLKIKDQLNTDISRLMAHDGHKLIETFLKQFENYISP